MCGIFIVVDPNNRVSDEEFSNGLETLHHRGPDATGIRAFEEGRVKMGHKRLSIIDLSEKGSQPMTNEDNSIWLVYNGEIYNHIELRDELIKKGHHYASRTDSETIIHGYEQWGENLPTQLNGMFSFGIYDQNKRSLFCSRDRLGIKPFYYYWDGRFFAAASEIKALLSLPGLDFGLRSEGFLDYLNYWYVPGPSTVWKNIFQLLPGHNLTIDFQGNLELNHYWSLPTEVTRIKPKDAEEQSWEILKDSVSRQMIADVPVGVFLSGGYDSSFLLWGAKKVNPDVSSFTIGFDEFSRSEHKEAGEIARFLNSDHHLKMLPENFMDDLEQLFRWFDEPYAITSMMSYFQVSKFASESNKVVLAGDGGDEAFGGYNWYREIYKKCNSPRNSISYFLKKGKEKEIFLKSEYHKIMGGGKSPRPRYLNLVSKDISGSELDPYLSYDLPKDFNYSGPVKFFQYLDYKRFVPEAALIRADRASMANSLEVRVPFLDHRLVEMSLSWPENIWFSNKVKKPRLHEKLKNIFPDEILNFPKRGFGNPRDHFYKNSYKVRERLMESPLFSDGYLNPALKKDNLISLDKSSLWLLTILDLWYCKWHKN